MLLVCSFEAEADGKSIGISKIVLMDEDDADDELFEDNENNEEGKDENEGSTYHALVSCHGAPPIVAPCF